MTDVFPFPSHHARLPALVLRTCGLADGVVVVKVIGDVDLATRSQLARGLARAMAHPVPRLLVCDLTRVDFLAGTGVSTLAEARSELVKRGGTLRVVATGRVVRRVLRVTGQIGPLGVVTDLRSALVGFSPARTTDLVGKLRRAR